MQSITFFLVDFSESDRISLELCFFFFPTKRSHANEGRTKLIELRWVIVFSFFFFLFLLQAAEVDLAYFLVCFFVARDVVVVGQLPIYTVGSAVG